MSTAWLGKARLRFMQGGPAIMASPTARGYSYRVMDSGLVSSIYAFCAASPFLSGLGTAMTAVGLPGALFLVGLIGGFGHCTGMCGPFVLAQITGDADRMMSSGIGEWRRLRGAALVPYHLGRVTTYSALGAVAGSIGGLAVTLSGYRWIPATLLGLAALLFMAQGMAGLGRLIGNPLGDVLEGLLERVAHPLLADPRGLRGYLLGVTLGFLPCGFLYGALSAAAGSGSAGRGLLAMAAFTLGTVPNLVLVGYVGVFFGRRSLKAARFVAVPLMLVNAGFLGFLAVRALG